MTTIKRTQRTKLGGFALTELLFAIIILGILASQIAPRYTAYRAQGEAREEALKLSEFKGSVEGLYGSKINFTGLDSYAQYRLLAPNTYEDTGTQLLSSWQTPVSISAAASGTYTITVEGVPDGQVCQTLVNQARIQGWTDISDGSASLTSGHPADATELEILSFCGGGGDAGVTVDVSFQYTV